MAGSNNIPKYALWNDEDELLEFKVRGPAWGQVDGTLITTATLTAQQLLSPFYFNGTTPAAITGPSLQQLLDTFGTNYLSTVGSTMQFTIQNMASYPITITFPGIGVVTIPAGPGTFFTVGFVVQPPTLASAPLNSIAFYQPITNTSGGSIPISGFGYVVNTPAGLQANTLVGSIPVLIINGNGQTGTTTTISLDAALTSFDALVNSGGTGIVVVTAAGTTALRTIVGTSPIVVTNGNGVAGNPTISLNVAALVIPASQVTVSPAVDGQTNVQSALQSIAASVPAIPSGVGYVTEGPPGTFNLRTFQAGLNIALVNANGSLGNTTIAFNPAGASVGIALSTPQLTYTLADDFLVWNGTQWIGTSSLTPATALPTTPALWVQNNVFNGSLNLQNWDTMGRVVNTENATFGSIAGVYKEVELIGTGEGVIANLQNPTNGLLTLLQNNNALVVNPSTFVARALAVQTTIPSGSLFEYNPASAGYALPRFEWANILMNGNINGQVITGTSYVTVSSLKFKKDISPCKELLPSALTLIKNLDVKAFRYNNEEATTPKRLGIIIEELESLTKLGASILVNKDDPERPGIKTDQLLMVLVQAVRELAALAKV